MDARLRMGFYLQEYSTIQYWLSDDSFCGSLGFVVVLGAWKAFHTPKTTEIPRDPL